MPTFQDQIKDGQILLLAAIGDEQVPNTYPALLDTGAQRTMISPRVVDSTDLKAIGYAPIVGVDGKPFQAETYRTTISIPIGRGNVIVSSGGELDVVQLPFQPENFDILLGMDFLTLLHFTMYGGSFILSN